LLPGLSSRSKRAGDQPIIWLDVYYNTYDNFLEIITIFYRRTIDGHLERREVNTSGLKAGAFQSICMLDYWFWM
jgi:predicted N-acyltransferase